MKSDKEKSQIKQIGEIIYLITTFWPIFVYGGFVMAYRKMKGWFDAR